MTRSAAQAQLQADQTKLDQLTSGTPDTALKTEQARVDALQQQAQTAAAAAQPTVQLTAPFDGTPVTYPVRVDVASLPDGVRIGMSADIDAGSGNGPAVLTVPITAVRNNNGRTVVTVIDGGGQSHDAPVQVGHLDRERYPDRQRRERGRNGGRLSAADGRLPEAALIRSGRQVGV